MSSLGFCMMECLITLIILTVGIFGVVKIYVHAIQFSYEASSYELLANVSDDIVQILKAKYKKSPYRTHNNSSNCQIVLKIDQGSIIDVSNNQSCIFNIFINESTWGLISSDFNGVACIDISISKNKISTDIKVSVVPINNQMKEASCFSYSGLHGLKFETTI